MVRVSAMCFGWVLGCILRGFALGQSIERLVRDRGGVVSVARCDTVTNPVAHPPTAVLLSPLDLTGSPQGLLDRIPSLDVGPHDDRHDLLRARSCAFDRYRSSRALPGLGGVWMGLDLCSILAFVLSLIMMFVFWSYGRQRLWIQTPT